MRHPRTGPVNAGTLLSDRRAITALEYGIIASALAFVIVAIFTNLGTPLSTIFSNVGTRL